MIDKVNLLNMSEPDLAAWLKERKQPRYRAVQILQWIHQYQVTDFAKMTNLSKTLRTQLAEDAVIEPPRLLTEHISEDGTRKWLLRLADGNAIETVCIPEAKRVTLCISSQVGCALNCSFCATGKEGFNRNLSLAEIIGQLWFAQSHLQDLPMQITNVVMMGMGEPLLNYQPVVAALRLMLDDRAYGLSKYRVTLSTSGVLPALRRLRDDVPVALAVSLHAPYDELRNQLVPINKKYPLADLMALCRDYYPATSKRCVTFEYVMLAGVNDSIEQAQSLVRLLSGMHAKVNLIPFNPFPRTQYQCSTDEVIDAFQRYLVDHGVATWRRKTRGDDVSGACGQLAGQIQDRTGRHQRWLKTGRLIPVKVVEQ